MMPPKRKHSDGDSALVKHSVHCITTTTVHEADLKWSIQQFGPKFQNKEVGKSLKSATFFSSNDDQVNWYLKLYPNGELEDCKGHISLFIVPAPESKATPDCPVEVCLSIFNGHTDLEVYPDDFSCKYSLDDVGGYGYDKLAQAKLPIENLVVCCTVKYEVERMETIAQPFRRTRQADLTSDLKKFLPMSMSNGDVTFTVGKMEFQAHMAILSARSPVFAAMFQNEMREKAQNRVDIVDLESDVFQALLRFIYSDQVDLTVETAKSILAAANRYLLDLLKWKCEEFLIENVTVNNCSEPLVLSDMHKANNLKAVTTSFIRKAFADVKKTDGWKNLIASSRPEFLRKIIENVFLSV